MVAGLISLVWAIYPMSIDNGYCGPVVKIALFGVVVSGGEQIPGSPSPYIAACRTSAILQLAGASLVALVGIALLIVAVRIFRQGREQ